MGVGRKREIISLFLKRRRCGTILFGNKWEKGENDIAANAGLSILGICGQRTMTNEGAKRNVPHLLHAQQALSNCGQYRKAPMPKVPRQFYLVSCFWGLTVL